MNWSTVWELTKINILYSNPRTLTAIKRKQEQRPNQHFSAYKSMFRQQGILIALFTVIYAYLFVGMDFRRYPGYFSFYVATFFLMATISAFTAMYTIFYESNDVKLYVHLPVKPSELYMAKVISSLGMGSVFLMPLLSLFFMAYWQMAGLVLAIPLTLVLFSTICQVYQGLNPKNNIKTVAVTWLLSYFYYWIGKKVHTKTTPYVEKI